MIHLLVVNISGPTKVIVSDSALVVVYNLQLTVACHSSILSFPSFEIGIIFAFGVEFYREQCSVYNTNIMRNVVFFVKVMCHYLSFFPRPAARNMPPRAKLVAR